MAFPARSISRTGKHVILNLHALRGNRATTMRTGSIHSRRQLVRTLSSSAHHGEPDSAADLVEIMRSIVEGGKRIGRKQDIVRKEVVKVFCSRYSELDGAGKEELLINMARKFTPTREHVAAAMDRYTSSVSPQGLPSLQPAAPQREASALGDRRERDPDDATGAAAASHGGAEDGGRPGEGVREGAGHARALERLREDLSPEYEALFRTLATESDDGVRFVVDLRQDLLEVIKGGRKGEGEGGDAAGAGRLLTTLDGTLRSLLQTWFGVGFLELRRITYEGSGGALLEKIARYEAVHPVHSLSELKRRLGRGRRCFAFFHPCLPGEPLVFVHVALLPGMAGSMEDIRGRGRSGRRDGEEQRALEDGEEGVEEDQARCAVFYSITSTQKGLQGVQLGNFLIKRVVAELRAELPQLEIFATLSPVPSFRKWLNKKAKHRAALGDVHHELSGELLLTTEEALAILSDKSPRDGALVDAIRGAITENGPTGGEESLRLEREALALLLSDRGPMTAEWIRRRQRDGDGDGDDGSAALATPEGGGGEEARGGASNGGVNAAEKALTRLAARYLARETVRGRILDPVGNFHVSNGARVDRVNWMADSSARGVDQSFGLMVNYVYDLLEIESNNRQYLSRGEVPASDGVKKLAWSLAEEMGQTAKPRPPSGFL